jgi:uncharacterized membrane protein YdjX (TVP38/TMEM64 family)
MKKTALAAAILLAIMIPLYLWWDHPFSPAVLLAELQKLAGDSNRLREAFLGQGAMAPALFVGLQVLQVVFFPIPGEASGFLGGYLFGTWGGFLYSTIGLTVGSLLAFGFSSLFGRAINKRIATTQLYRRFNHLVARGGFFIPLLLFLIPGFPKDSLSYLLGLSRMPWQAFFLIALVGRMPGTLVLSLEGAQIYQRNYIMLALLLVLTLVVSVPFYLNRQRLFTWLERLSGHGDGKQAGGKPPGQAADGRL